MSRGVSATAPVRCPACPTPTLTFTHGLILGQLSLIGLAVLFLRYVVFEEPSKSAPVEASARGDFAALRQADKRDRRRKRRRASSVASGSKAALQSASDQHILSGLGYDVATHAAESTDWLNVIVAQVIAAYRATVHSNGSIAGLGAKGIVEEALNPVKPDDDVPGMVSIDRIVVTEVDLGEDYPVVTNARVRPSDESGRVRIEIDVDYSDHVTLAIDTRVVVNVPRPRFAVLPVSLGFTLVKFSATLAIEIPPLSPDMPLSALVSLHPDFALELQTTSLIGSRAKLQDIPKVEQLIISRMRAWMVDHIVWPHKLAIPLPKVLAPPLDGSELEPGADYEFIDDTAEAAIPSSPNGEDPEEDEADADGDEAITDDEADLDQTVRRRTSPPASALPNRLYPPVRPNGVARSMSGASSASMNSLYGQPNAMPGLLPMPATPTRPAARTTSRPSLADARQRKSAAQSFARSPLTPATIT